MIFTATSLAKIRAGTKTQTRRLWKAPHVKVGKAYRIRTSRWYGYPDNAVTIRITSIRREPLGSITVADARKEGCESLSAFRELWEDLHGKWEPERVVYVVDFELVPEG